MLINRAMTFRQETFISYETEDNNIWKRYSLLCETVRTYERPMPQHLERAMAASEKPHSALRISKKVRQQNISSLKSVILAILNLLLVTIWDV